MKPLIALMLLLLTGCDKPKTATQAYGLADVADANARTALGRFQELESRISDLERKLDTLESAQELAKQNEDALFDNGKLYQQQIDQIRNHYNDHLVNWHGRQ